MLNIWTPTDSSFVNHICALQHSLSGEQLKPEKVAIFRSNRCPYGGYELLRFQIQPHIVTIGKNHAAISTRSVSYALLAKEGEKPRFSLIPLNFGAEGIYEINLILKFRATEANVSSFAIFFGHLSNRPPFYFFERFSEITSLCQEVPHTDVERIRHTLLALFKSPDGDTLELGPTEHQHFLFGSYFIFKMPCFYKGALYITKLRLAEGGIPQMDNDDQSQIEGVFDDEESYSYYPLERSLELKSAVLPRSGSRKLVRFINLGLTLDHLIQIPVIPLFLFHLFIVLSYGESNQVFAYYEAIQKSVILDFLCLVIGFVGTLGVIFRYAFLEFLIYARKFVPSVWSQMADAASRQSVAGVKALGAPLFIVVNFLEFSFRAFMALSLFLYGMANIPWGLNFLPSANLGQVILTILLNIPMIGGLLKRVFIANDFAPFQFSGMTASFISVAVAFIFSTVLIGICGKLISLGLAKED